MRQKFWYWFRKNILKIDDGYVIPKKWVFVPWILFPVSMWVQNRNPRYDVLYNSIIFNGYRYPLSLFIHLRDVNAFILTKEKGAVSEVKINIAIEKEHA